MTGPDVRAGRVVSRWRRFAYSPSLLALGSYLVLSALLFARALRHPFHLQVGNATDGLLAMWFLKWLPFAISHGDNPLLTNYLDYPAGVNLMWNGSMPLVDLVLAPLTTTLGPIFTYNLMCTLAVTLSAWSAFLFIRRYVERPLAAAVGGLLYGFSPYMMAHLLGHPALFIVFIPPLIFLLLDEALVRQERRPVVTGILLGLLGSAQFLIGQEVLLLTALVAFFAVVLLVTLYPRAAWARAGEALRTLGVAAVVFLLVCAVPIGVQFFGPQQLHGIAQGANSFVSDVFGFVVPSPLQAIAPRSLTAFSDKFLGGLAEVTNSYLGIGLIIVLAFVAIRYWSSPVVRVVTLLGTFLAMLSLGQTIHIGGRITKIPVFVVALVFPLLQRWVPARVMLYGVILLWLGMIKLSFLDNILPVRMMLFVFLAAGIGLAVLVDAILRARPSRWRLAGGGLVVASLALLVPSWPYPATAPPVPDFFKSAAVTQIPEGSVALLAPFSAATVNGVAPMYWQAASGMRFRMPEGYIFVPGPSPNPPPSATQTLMRAVEDHGDLAVFTDTVQHEMLGELVSWKVQTVIIGPMPHQDKMIEVFKTLLGRDPSYVGGVYVWWQVPS
jgi:hypothetical protein